MPRILSLNPHLDGLPVWKDATVAVTSIDAGFHGKNRVRKALFVHSVVQEFDVVLIPNDLWLAAICSLFTRVALLGFYYDASPGMRSLRERLRRAKYSLLTKRLDRILVHTLVEAGLYSKILGIRPERFEFIPYYAYSDALGGAARRTPAEGKPMVLAPGRHRDFACFCNSVATLNARSVIVCGLSDLADVKRAAAGSNVEIHSEVSRSRYRQLMAEADVVVIPLYADRWQRSLGQIALFDAVLMKKPVIVARTFQLADYVSAGEVLFYEPDDAADLRRQLEKVMRSPELRESLTAKAFRRITTDFTETAFATSLAAACS